MEFFREKGSKDPRGFSGLVEDALVIGAVAYGYTPETPNGEFERFASVISKMVADRLKEEGVIPEKKGN